MGPSARVAVVGWLHEGNVLLAAAWRNRGIDAALVDPFQAVARLRPGEVAVNRLDVLATLDGVEPGLETFDELEELGVRVLNRPVSLMAVHDKLRTAKLLARAGIPHPRTAHLAVPTAETPIAPPVVVKPRFGSWGADVFRCETVGELRRVLHGVATRPWFVKHGAIVQELLPPVRHDLRLVVAGGRVVGAVQRVPRPGEWRTNVALGARCRPIVPSQDAVALGLRTVAVTGADLVGVDLFPTADGYVVLELNGAVDFAGEYSLPGSDVYEAAAEALDLRPAEARVAAAAR